MRLILSAWLILPDSLKAIGSYGLPEEVLRGIQIDPNPDTTLLAKTIRLVEVLVEWWIICAIATVATLGAKGYFTRAVEHLRVGLARQQREALHLKEVLTDTRDKHQLTMRRAKDKTATIKRLANEIREMEERIKKMPKKPTRDTR
jgi:hypothetical protein